MGIYLRFQQITPPAPLITPELAKRHTRIDSDSDDDDLLEIYIGSATKICEKFLNRSILNQTIRQTWTYSRPADTQPTMFGYGLAMYDAGFPYVGGAGFESWAARDWSDIAAESRVQIHYGAVQNIQSVTLQLWDGNTIQLVANTDYHYDIQNEPARLHLSHPWVAHPHVANHQVIYDAGTWGANSQSVPSDIIHAVLVTTSRIYEARGDIGDPTTFLPKAAESLLINHKNWVFK